MIPDCLFCKIAAHEIPSQIVYEDDLVIAINDINPAAPAHVLIMPKEHWASLDQVDEKQQLWLGHIQVIAALIAKNLGLAENGYRLVCNCGADGGQTVMHIHYHLLGGRGLGWPPG